MSDAIAHRGPDDHGSVMCGHVGLGFRRLSIIDLAGGHQPMSDEEKTVWIVFNGEIYNFRELRAELIQCGHRFLTRSDTEVIVHGYKHWGTGVFDRLNGMFGLAIWDVNRERLVLARDAMGIKPLYFRNAGGTLTFASELRAILAADDAVPDVDPAAVNLFLKFRYTPSPLTVFKGIRKLAPGTMLIAEHGECREERWYNYTPVPFDSRHDAEEARGELLRLYRAAVDRHLLSDVPVGVLLSGGLDSGLLLALMNEHGGSWPAYTVGYGHSEYKDDELTDAAATAAALHARHVIVQIDRRRFEASLPSIVNAVEEPIASSSIVPMYFVSERARADVKVVLMGQGPDELFCGYRRHFGVHYGSRWRRVPPAVRRLIASGVQRLPRNETAKRGAYALGVTDRLERYHHVFALAPMDAVDALFRDGVLPHAEEGTAVEYWADLVPQMQYLDDLAGFQLLEIRSSLPDELLMYADKLSMAHGLEVRVPYLDRTVVEFAQRLRSDLKIRGRTGKWLHREVCRDFLGAGVLKRKKRGFAVNVVDEWFASTAKGAIADFLLDRDALIFELLDPDRVRRLLDEHRTGRQDNHKLLFSLVVLEQWLRQARPQAQPL